MKYLLHRDKPFETTIIYQNILVRIRKAISFISSTGHLEFAIGTFMTAAEIISNHKIYLTNIQDVSSPLL